MSVLSTAARGGQVLAALRPTDAGEPFARLIGRPTAHHGPGCGLDMVAPASWGGRLAAQSPKRAPVRRGLFASVW